METLEKIKTNLARFIEKNKMETDSFFEEAGVNKDELLDNPLAVKDVFFQFLDRFSLALPELLDENFSPKPLAMFKKRNGQEVSLALIDALRDVAYFYREYRAIKYREKPRFLSFDTKDPAKIAQEIFHIIDFESYRKKFSEATQKQIPYIMHDFFDNIERKIGLKIFLFEKSKNSYNFDGVYFYKPAGVAFVNALNVSFASTLFTAFHEMYHFLVDDGNVKEAVDLFDENEYGTAAEDINANRFAANLLLYGADEDMLKLKFDTTLELLKEIMKKYSISKAALGIKLQEDLSHFQTGHLHKGFVNPDTKFIKELIAFELEEGLISTRKAAQILEYLQLKA